MTILDSALTAVKFPSADGFWRLGERAELQGLLGLCLWIALIFAVVHSGMQGAG
jgi:hypothetical protein